MPLFSLLTATVLLIALPQPTLQPIAPSIPTAPATPAARVEASAATGEAPPPRVEIGPAVLRIYGPSGEVVRVE